MVDTQKFIPELFNNLYQDFENHLRLENNRKIIFSGKFGTGKTTFIKKFFSEKKDYDVIHLYPINYSAFSNNDIFSYIKYDIIYEMLESEFIDFKNRDFDALKDGSQFAKENIFKLSSLLLLLIPKMGRQLSQFSKELESLIENFQKYNPDTDSKAITIAEIFKSYEKKDYELYEFNELTHIIRNAILARKAEDPSRKVILIIDDIDRIDPSHIFRIFNIFSAQFDKSRKDSDNKFGFDSIILVCDITNIKNIYNHIYGIDTDFNGYIDKFFSREIYYFDISHNIISYIGKLVNGIKFKGDSESHTNYLNSNKFLKEKLIFILTNLVFTNQLNIRTILRNYEKNINLKTKIIVSHTNRNNSFSDWKFSGLEVIRILSKYFTDVRSMSKAILACENTNDIFNNFGNTTRFLFGELFMLLNKLKNNEAHDISSTSNYSDKNSGLNVKYKIEYQNKSLGIFTAELINFRYSSETPTYDGDKINIKLYFKFLDELLSILKEKKYLE